MYEEIPFHRTVASVVFYPHSPHGQRSEEEKPVPFLDYSGVMKERVVSDLRTYRNGTYSGHVRREEHGRLIISESGVTGRYYGLEDTIRDGSPMGSRVDEKTDIALPFLALPETWESEYDAQPRFRPLPVLTEPVPAVGTVWIWNTVMWVGWSGDRSGFAVPVSVRLRYDGSAAFQGSPVRQVSGSFRIPGYVSSDTAVRLEGSHSLVIMFPEDSPNPVFLKDSVTRSLTESSGEVFGYRGFFIHWYSYPDPAEKPVEKPDIEGVDMVETGDGPALRIGSLRFFPDTARLLPEEEARIAGVARLLAEEAQGSILVVGHTADVGSADSQKKLSLERARRITEILISEGVDPHRLMYEGRGGSEPIAENVTEKGRAQNRRVEFIFLDR